jgi:predicted ATP-dependent Lon-type protease
MRWQIVITKVSVEILLTARNAGLMEEREQVVISRLETGFLKPLFPDLRPSEEAFREFCVKPAVELCQRVRDELQEHPFERVLEEFLHELR